MRTGTSVGPFHDCIDPLPDAFAELGVAECELDVPQARRVRNV
ncbi:hypothetical protein [Halorientalis sp.]|nr:hypothetical protein [Halorientalis sp.]